MLRNTCPLMIQMVVVFLHLPCCCFPSPALLLFSLSVDWPVQHDIAGSSAGKQRDDSDMAPLHAILSKRYATGLDRRQCPIGVH